MNDTYKKMSSSELDRFKKYLDSIKNAAKFIDDHFIDKEMRYATANNVVSVLFGRENFMHLCGIQYKKKSVAFFKDAKNGRIFLNGIKIKSDGTTFQKLKVLGHIECLVKNGVLLTGNGVFLNFSFDSALKAGGRNVKFALTLKNESGDCIPVSLFNTVRDQHKFPRGELVTSLEEYDLIGNFIQKHI